MTPRNAAYLAILASLRQESYILPILQKWQREFSPTPRDYAFAYELAAGTTRMALALDYLAATLSPHKKISLKIKQKALLRMSIYQYHFMDKVPLYAIINETIELAKKYCHVTFANYLNALLRQIENVHLELPSDHSLKSLSVRYSYPEFYVSKLLEEFELNEAIRILETGNQPPVIMARMRSDRVSNEQLPVDVIEGSRMKEVSTSPDYYIQNATPVALIMDLSSKITSSQTILDLCASPGGKLLAVHDLFPHAKLFANDVSQEKLQRLSENLIKYGVTANLTCGSGNDYPTTMKFDLIILDVPCSNTGVYNKRPEARWRCSSETLNELKNIQSRLLQHAVRLINPGGCIWYMTCSILKDENSQFLKEICPHIGLKVVYEKTILPNNEGWDGGFAALCRVNG